MGGEVNPEAAAEWPTCRALWFSRALTAHRVLSTRLASAKAHTKMAPSIKELIAVGNVFGFDSSEGALEPELQAHGMAANGDPPSADIRVSVVATVYNEGESIQEWISDLLAQTRRPDEIVIVDAGSKDRTQEILKGLEAEGKLRLFVAPGASIPQGRNRAIKAASFDIVAVTDAGTRVHADWLEKLIEPFAAGDVDVVAGFFTPQGRTRKGKVIAAVITPHESEIDGDSFLPSSRSVAFRRDAWARVGGYPTWLRTGEDLVFDVRLRSQGYRVAFAPAAIVDWYPQEDLRGFFKQYLFYARGDGHALMWPGRHAIRYATYSAALIWLVRGRSVRSAALALPVSGLYLKKFVRRLWLHSPLERRSEMAAATLFVPVVVAVGDVGKMIGFPVGIWQRLRAGDPRRLEYLDMRAHRDASR